MVLIDRWVLPASRPLSTLCSSFSAPPPPPLLVTRVHRLPDAPLPPAAPPLHAEGGGVAAGVDRRLLDHAAGMVEVGPGPHLREPAVGQPAGSPQGRIGRRPEPHRDR